MMNQGKSILSFLATEEMSFCKQRGPLSGLLTSFPPELVEHMGGDVQVVSKKYDECFLVALLQCEAPVRYVNVGLDSPQ